MGQYYFGVIRDKDSREVIAAQYACKLHETSRGDLMYMAYALSRNGVGYMQRVCWAGDYSDIQDANGHNLYDRLHDREDTLPAWVPEVEAQSPYNRRFRSDKARWKAIDKFHAFRHQWWLEHIAKNEEGDFRDELRYICNHDRHEFIDLSKVKSSEDGFNNPLAVLTCDPTCRVSGGGDYRYQDNYAMYSAWYDNILSTEPSAPEGYQEVNANFGTEHPIWDYSGLAETLYGERYYDAPYPHYGDFHTFLTHGRFEEFQKSLCVLPLPELKAMYSQWYQNLNLEHVFKAYDTIARVLKQDPTLSQKHKGVTFRVSKFNLHYLDCDDVSVCIFRERKNSPWRMLDSRADYNHIQYDCDRKARAFHRRRLETIKAGFYAAA